MITIMKDQKVSTTLGAVILIIITATVAWFVLICFKNYPVKYHIESAIISENKNIKEDVKVEDELWNQLIQDSKNNNLIRENFSISKVNDEETIALGSSKNDCLNDCGGANVFAYRLNSFERWIINITQEGFYCSDLQKFSNSQVNFIRENYTEKCVEWDESGRISYKDIMDFQNNKKMSEKIDASNWKHVRKSVEDFLVPKEWEALDGFDDIGYKMGTDKQIIIGVHGAPLDGGTDISEKWEGAVQQEVNFLKKNYDSCDFIVDEMDFKFFRCEKDMDDEYHLSYIKIKESEYCRVDKCFDSTIMSVICKEKEYCDDKNNNIVRTILENAKVSKEKFMPLVNDH